MDRSDRWLLPDGVEEILPDHAWQFEQKRNLLLENFHRWGFDLVLPPIIEYLDSLLTGAGQDLVTRTFTVTDQLTGRLMGIRADMTPQVARIDAHYLHQQIVTSGTLTESTTDDAAAFNAATLTQVPNRLCYAGPTLQTLPRTLGGSREPFQFGAELFGVADVQGDCEIVALMVDSLACLGVSKLCLDIGHVGVLRALFSKHDIGAGAQDGILNALLTKSEADIRSAVTSAGIGSDAVEDFQDLARFTGTSEVLDDARERFRNDAQVRLRLEELVAFLAIVESFVPDIDVTVDLAELRGYRYHTGILYSLLAPGYAKPVARGGRYDGVGMVFGRARPATGFSGDLRQLLQFGRSEVETENLTKQVIAAPFESDATLGSFIKLLRTEGHRVVRIMPGQTARDIRECTREVRRVTGPDSKQHWEIAELS